MGKGYVPGVEIRAKKETRIFWYSDCGVNAISNGIIVHRDLLKEDPELVRRFVTASLRGFLYARQNPDEAVAITKKFSEAVVPEIARRELEMSWDTWVTPNTAGKALGWMSDKDWEATVQVLKEYGGVTTPLQASALYTNELVPAGAEFVPPQPKVAGAASAGRSLVVRTTLPRISQCDQGLRHRRWAGAGARPDFRGSAARGVSFDSRAKRLRQEHAA